MSKVTGAAPHSTASVVRDGRRRTRQSRKKLIDAQRQSDTGGSATIKRRRPEKMLANVQTPDDHAFATGRRFKALIAAAVLIQIVARHWRSSGTLRKPMTDKHNAQARH